MCIYDGQRRVSCGVNYGPWGPAGRAYSRLTVHGRQDCRERKTNRLPRKAVEACSSELFFKGSVLIAQSKKKRGGEKIEKMEGLGTSNFLEYPNP